MKTWMPTLGRSRVFVFHLFTPLTLQINFLRTTFPHHSSRQLVAAYKSAQQDLNAALDILLDTPLETRQETTITEQTSLQTSSQPSKNLANNQQIGGPPSTPQPATSPPSGNPNHVGKHWSWCSPEFSEVSSGGIENLPDLFSQSASLRAKFLLRDIITYHPTTYSVGIKPENRNPINTGTLSGWNYDPATTAPLFRIRYFCSGNKDQCCSLPSVLKSQRQLKCSVELNVMVSVGKYCAYISGNHGPNYKPGAVKKSLSWSQKKKIDEMDNFGDSSQILNTTAKAAHINISSSSKSTPPPLQAVQNRLAYTRHRHNNSQTEFQILLSYMEDPLYRPYILWNNLKEVGPNGKIVVICSSSYLLDKMKIFCSRNAGMDSGWKWTHGGHPCWVISGDYGSNGFGGVFFFTNSGKAKVIQLALSKVIELGIKDESWKPTCHNS